MPVSGLYRRASPINQSGRQNRVRKWGDPELLDLGAEFANVVALTL